MDALMISLNESMESCVVITNEIKETVGCIAVLEGKVANEGLSFQKAKDAAVALFKKARDLFFSLLGKIKDIFKSLRNFFRKVINGGEFNENDPFIEKTARAMEEGKVKLDIMLPFNLEALQKRCEVIQTALSDRLEMLILNPTGGLLTLSKNLKNVLEQFERTWLEADNSIGGAAYQILRLSKKILDKPVINEVNAQLEEIDIQKDPTNFYPQLLRELLDSKDILLDGMAYIERMNNAMVELENIFKTIKDLECLNPKSPNAAAKNFVETAEAIKLISGVITNEMQFTAEASKKIMAFNKVRLTSIKNIVDAARKDTLMHG